ncbi:MAG: polysaccharide lyase [Candidatus Methylacidiphilales bacterium]
MFKEKRNKWALAGLILAAAGGVFWVTHLYHPGPMWVNDDFEDGVDPVWMWEIAHEGQAQVVADPTNPTNQVIYFKIKRDDPNVKKSKRVEIKLGTVKMGSSWRYAFSALLPEDYALDQSSENLAQWHEMPDFILGEFWRSPPLKIMTRDGRWILNRKVSDLKVNRFIGLKSKAIHTEFDIDLGPAENMKWVRWEFHVKWSHRDDGRLLVFRDGVEVHNVSGPTTYNDWKGPYFKIGMYKPDWTVYPERSVLEMRDVYYDDILAEPIEDMP